MIDSLSNDQMRAFDLMVKPLNKVSRIVGYAGTGKTTTLAAAAKELGGDCVVLCPTNKAATVLRQKGIPRAQTVHSLLYTPSPIDIPKEDKDGNVLYQLDENGHPLLHKGEKIPIIERQELGFSLKMTEGLPRIALVDEASMIGKEIYKDLLETFDHVVLIGDGFQLPPVMDVDVLNSESADVRLTEVHRVALGNPITRFATDIRNNVAIDFNNYRDESGAIGLISKNNPGLFPGMVEHNYQAICGKNVTRHWINERTRHAMGLEPHTLMAGEDIVCLENWREQDDDGKRNLIFYNGEIVTVDGDYQKTDDDMRAVLVKLQKAGSKFVFPFWNPDYFDLMDSKGSAWFNEYKRRQASPKKPLRGIKFDYCYGITAHKSQGSEFDNVIVFDERHASRGFEQRWLYTAVTRAKKKLRVVR